MLVFFPMKKKKIDVHVMKYNYKYDFIFTVDDQLIFIPCIL